MRPRLRSRAVAVVTVGLLAACGQVPDAAPEQPEATPEQPEATPEQPEATPEQPEAAPEPDEPADERDPEDPDDPDPAGTPQPVGTPGTDPVATEDFPSLEGEQALLTDVRVGAHEGFDRVVFEFLEDVTPGYLVAYVDPPVVEDASGEEVDVAGEVFLEVRMTPATGVDIDGPEPEQIYEGPDRLEPATTVAVAEVVLVGDHHADLGWVVGLDRRQPFAVAVLDAPARLVVDVVPADAAGR